MRPSDFSINVCFFKELAKNRIVPIQLDHYIDYFIEFISIGFHGIRKGDEEKLASIREIRGCNQLFTNPSAIATALRMAMDLLTVS